jgi:hypothetical protein
LTRGLKIGRWDARWGKANGRAGRDDGRRRAAGRGRGVVVVVVVVVGIVGVSVEET